MALAQSKLKDNLVDWMSAVTTDQVEALTNFVDAYDLYAQDATATSGGDFVSANKAEMLSILLTLPPIGTAISAAEIFALAVSTYWIGGVLTPSTVSATFVPDALKSLLIPIFSDVTIEKTYEICADQLATAMHTVTLTVATVAPGTPPIVGVLV